MKVLPIACCVVVLSQASAYAQSPTMCELRIGSFAVGGSVGLQVAEANISYGRISDDVWTEANARSGRSWSGEFSAPIMPGWGARVDYSRGHVAVERKLVTSGMFSEDRIREGEVAVRHLTVGVLHAVSPPRGPCGYVGGGVGIYQFDYRGQRARNGGLFGVAGMEFGVGERSGLAFEMQLHAAHNDYEGALRAETVLMLRPAVMFRVRF